MQDFDNKIRPEAFAEVWRFFGEPLDLTLHKAKSLITFADLNNTPGNLLLRICGIEK